MPIVVIGLLLATITPLLSRYWHLSDMTRGFVIGTGLGLEMLGLILIVRHKRNAKA